MRAFRALVKVATSTVLSTLVSTADGSARSFWVPGNSSTPKPWFRNPKASLKALLSMDDMDNSSTKKVINT